jgi:hypothetical protein
MDTNLNAARLIRDIAKVIEVDHEVARGWVDVHGLSSLEDVRVTVDTGAIELNRRQQGLLTSAIEKQRRQVLVRQRLHSCQQRFRSGRYRRPPPPPPSGPP